jgi:hypothetical protein
MKLTLEELTWVDQKLAGYEIKYQEIYDEIKDHILTSMETLRANHDERDVEVLFNEVVKKQFPGYWPFENIVREYVKAYRQKIWKTMWANFTHFFNLQTIPAMVLLLVGSYYLPHGKPATVSMMILLLILSIVPAAYVYIKGRAIKTDKGKYSLVKSYVTHSCNLLIVLFNLLFNLIGRAAKDWEPASFLNPMNYPPVVCVLLIILSFVYCLGCIRLSRQEFKIAG